jgi:uncharacterized protein YcbK (DUF882 family)
MAKRIQRRRKRGWRKPEGVVNCTRPSKWANPFRVGSPSTPNAQMAVAKFSSHLHCGLLDFTIADVKEELRGKDLMCWCGLDKPCHVDVLLEVANGK